MTVSDDPPPAPDGYDVIVSTAYAGRIDGIAAGRAARRARRAGADDRRLGRAREDDDRGDDRVRPRPARARPGVRDRRRGARSSARTPAPARAGSSSRATSRIALSRRFRADIAVITNVDLDHHTTFGSRAEVEDLYAGWLAGLPGRGGRPRRRARARGAFCSPFAGEHNRRNAAAALAALELAGVARSEALRRRSSSSAAPAAGSKRAARPEECRCSTTTRTIPPSSRPRSRPPAS